MSYLNAILLALVQGAAELLPVSSSAHVILVQHWMGLDPSSPEMVFLLVMLHTGTMGAVLLYFRESWARMIRQDLKKLTKFLFIATAATGVLGFGLKELVEQVLLGGNGAEVEDLFRSRPAVATALSAAGLLILTSGLYQRRRSKLGIGDTQKEITTKSALIIGLVQGLCLPFRGFSRSGATISAALFLGIEKHLAENFSFLLAVIVTPPVIVRSIYKLAKASERTGVPLSDMMGQILLPGLTGAVFAFLSGMLALKFLSSLIEKGRWYYFGIYCFFVAALIASGV